MPFKVARSLVHSLKLANKAAWIVWCLSGARPDNLPKNPDRAYRHEGWQGWGHFLGAQWLKCSTLVPRVLAKAALAAPVLTSKPALPEAAAATVATITTVRAATAAATATTTTPTSIDTAKATATATATDTATATAKTAAAVNTTVAPPTASTCSDSSGARQSRFLPFDKALTIARSLQLNCAKDWREWCTSGKRPANIPYVLLCTVPRDP